MYKIESFELEKGYFVVTGGLGFLGKKHCEAICEYGGTPIILDICCEGAEEFNNYLYKKYKKKSVFFDIDIGCEESIKKIISKCQNLSQPIFGLVNNAARNPQVGRDGLENSQRLESFSLDVWEKDIRVGLTGAFLCTKYFGSLMNRSQGGVIVNISSDLGLIAPNQEIYKNELKGNDNQPVKPVTYSVIKSGIIGLTRYTATYWPTKVRCNCLCLAG